MNYFQHRQLFLNLPVANLGRSIAFFSGLGFEFNPQFTNDQAACMVVNDSAYVMLLQASFFKTFTKRDLCDTSQHTEALVAVSCPSRAAVDDIFRRALTAGAVLAIPAQDHGFMYSRSFYDLDNHHWEVLWVEAHAVQPSCGPAYGTA